mgnify:CR=1 FL=1
MLRVFAPPLLQRLLQGLPVLRAPVKQCQLHPAAPVPVGGSGQLRGQRALLGAVQVGPDSAPQRRVPDLLREDAGPCPGAGQPIPCEVCDLGAECGALNAQGFGGRGVAGGGKAALAVVEIATQEGRASKQEVASGTVLTGKRLRQFRQRLLCGHPVASLQRRPRLREDGVPAADRHGRR